MSWGIYDTVDGLWMGNSEGPIAHEEEALAVIVGMMCAVKLGHPFSRYEAREIPKRSRPWRWRDTLKTEMSNAEAIDRLEKGAV
jgi:hypothetical protein